MESPVYLDYNATTPIAEEVADEMLPYIRTHFGNPSSNYALGEISHAAVSKARMQVAELIGAQPEEITFTSGGTESNNLAIRGIAFANREKGKHIIISGVEHPSVSVVCDYLAAQGWHLSRVPVDRFGAVDPADIEKAIRPDTVLISIMHANNEVGTIQPIEEIGAIAQKNNSVFHTDAAQSLGKIETNVNRLGVDLLTIAGHKLYAPKGIGALYIKQGTQLEKLMYGAGQENGLRAGTENVPYIVALGKACELVQHSFNKNQSHMLKMRERLLCGFQNAGLALKLNADFKNCLPNTLSIAFEGVQAHDLVSAIGREVCISAGSACHAHSVEVSPVLKAMKTDVSTAVGTVRISTGKYTTGDEIDRAVKIISETVNRLL